MINKFVFTGLRSTKPEGRGCTTCFFSCLVLGATTNLATVTRQSCFVFFHSKVNVTEPQIEAGDIGDFI